MAIHNQSVLNDTGIPQLADAGIVIVHTEWNDFIVRELLKGCERKLREYGIGDPEKIKVPGAFELPFACRRYFESAEGKPGAPEAIIALGCVIRGGTPHFEYVCRAVTDGIAELNLRLPVPVIFGVLTVDNEEQARERAGGAHGHKGEEAALTALKMIALNREWGRRSR